METRGGSRSCNDDRNVMVTVTVATKTESKATHNVRNMERAIFQH